jgi:hypothetical protein
VDIVAITMVKNEDDIIEAFVRHTVHFVRWLVALDNGSTDDTLPILRALEREHLPLTVLEDRTFGKYQSKVMSSLMREWAVDRLKAKWILPLDGDEFVYCVGDSGLQMDETAAGMPVAISWKSYVPHADDDGSETNPVLRIRHRAVDGFKAAKVLVPGELAAMGGATLLQGNHEFAINEKRWPAISSQSTYLAHYPIRTPGQYLKKIAVSALQYRIVPDRDPHFGRHYREPFELLKRDPAAFAASYSTAAQNYLRLPREAVQEGTIVDPLPYRGGPLRYTRSVADASPALASVLAFAEELAVKFATATRCFGEDSRAALERTTAMIRTLQANAEKLVTTILEKDRELIEKEGLIQQQHCELMRLHEQLQVFRVSLEEKEAVIKSLHGRLLEIGRPQQVKSRFINFGPGSAMPAS